MASKAAVMAVLIIDRSGAVVFRGCWNNGRGLFGESRD
jgi:hypothetical protein